MIAILMTVAMLGQAEELEMIRIAHYPDYRIAPIGALTEEQAIKLFHYHHFKAIKYRSEFYRKILDGKIEVEPDNISIVRDLLRVDMQAMNEVVRNKRTNRSLRFQADKQFKLSLETLEHMQTK